MIAGAIIAGAIIAGASIYAAYKNNESAEDINKKSESFEREKLDYQKYLNANQNQIQASDSLKAGINPIAMSGGSLSAGNASLNLQQSDYSSIANAGAAIGSSMISAESNKEINDKNIAANASYVHAAADKEQAQANLAKQQFDQNSELHQEALNKAKYDSLRAQQEYEILKRKNQGQDQDGSYDGKPVSSESTSVKLGPASWSKSSSGQSRGSGDFIRSTEYGKFVSDHINKPNEWKNSGVVVDNSKNQNELQRYYDEGYIKLGTTKYNGRIYHLMCRARDKSYLSVSTPAGK